MLALDVGGCCVVASASLDGSVCVWDVGRGLCALVPRERSDRHAGAPILILQGLLLGGALPALLGCARDGTVTAWSVFSGRALLATAATGSPVNSLDVLFCGLHHIGAYAATGSSDGLVRL